MHRLLPSPHRPWPTGELYANDYAKAVLGATEVKEADSIKKELQTLWADLSRRLDALSNFHYTPKPIVKVRVRFASNTF
jgi:U3 small nucleolar ribonucleoprotein component